MRPGWLAPADAGVCPTVDVDEQGDRAYPRARGGMPGHRRTRGQQHRSPPRTRGYAPADDWRVDNQKLAPRTRGYARVQHGSRRGVLAAPHSRGDRPRPGNRPGRNETFTLHRREGAARQASGCRCGRAGGGGASGPSSARKGRQGTSRGDRRGLGHGLTRRRRRRGPRTMWRHHYGR